MTTQTPTTQTPRYIIRTSTAQMPASVRHPYCRVAVIEVEAGVETVSMISTRARGVRRIVKTWERCCVGRTPRSASARAYAAAEALISELTERDAREHVLSA